MILFIFMKLKSVQESEIKVCCVAIFDEWYLHMYV